MKYRDLREFLSALEQQDELRRVTAPVSPLGQKLYVPSKNAVAVAAPTTIAPDPTPPTGQTSAQHYITEVSRAGGFGKPT